LLAGAMNLAIAAAKAVGGVLSGSDTVTEVLLLTALRRSARPSARLRPRAVFLGVPGLGRDLVGGAVFAVYDGSTPFWVPRNG
jgi:hypothetical protein